MNGREGLEKLLIGWIGIGLLLLPAGYQLRMLSGIFRLDIYWWWCTGAFAWLYCYRFGYMLSKRFLFAIVPFLVFLAAVVFSWKEDDNSTSFFISCITGLGIFLFLVQIGEKIDCAIRMAVVAVVIQFLFAFHQIILYKPITAQFYNSGHWGNFLALMLPVIYVQLQQYWNQRLLRFLLIVSLLVVLVLLCWSMARAAILGAVTGISFLVLRKVNNRFRPFLFTGGLLLISYVTWLIFYTKSASLAGRKTVYSVCFEIWKHNWLTGVGPNRFSAVYNHYQVAFLQNARLPIEREMLATNMVEGFNLPLQLLVEYGIIGVALIVWIIIQVWQFLNKQAAEYLSALIILFTASLFSNPFHVTPVSFTGLLLLAAATRPVAVVFHRRFFGSTIIAIAQCILFLVYTGIQMGGEWYWKRASVQALYEGFSMAQPSYKKAARWLSGRGSFLFNYGAEAGIAGETELAITQLEAAAQRLASNQLYVYLGDAYLKSGKNREAERAYLLAIAMVPSMIYPKYQLIQFYIQQMNYVEACKWAKITLTYPVKIPTPEVFQLIREIRQQTAPYMHYCSG